ncbi:hypothetical protein [Agrobacterium salinitolerans]|uniref:hypothetical protein n=1 Tax=Agrobacterium salinitolerans TaxID=1183413 RepID=UPI0022B84AB7|nr:hypothetical protein [Agrobacterium salinitolerans]MCZ7885384.1 hypothetical protein [Agrobacterium salinitolerans]
MSKPYTHRPAGPALPKPQPVKPLPPGYWHGENKFHVWRSAGPDSIDRARGVVRDYEVFGLLDWHSGPRASQLHLSRHWTLRLLVVDGKMTAEANVVLYSGNAKKLPGVAEPERGVTITVSLSTPDEDAEVRKLKRYVLRLAPWASKRLGPVFETYLEDHGL